MTIQETEVFNQYFMNISNEKTQLEALPEGYYNATIKDIIITKEKKKQEYVKDGKSDTKINMQFVFEVEGETVIMQGETKPRLVYAWYNAVLGDKSNFYDRFLKYIFPKAMKIMFLVENDSRLLDTDIIPLETKYSVTAYIGNTSTAKKLNNLKVKLNLEVDSKGRNEVLSVKERI
jgi:hypothetical protein